MIYKYILTVLSLFIFVNSAKADHLLGGQIYYDYLGNNKYKISIELYLDCNAFVSFDIPLGYTIFNSNGTIYTERSIDFVNSSPIIAPTNPCMVVPTGMCLSKGVYIDTVVLNQNIGGYTVTYQRCCWTANISNVTTPDNNGMTLTTVIPGTAVISSQNNSARFISLPPVFLCSNQTIDIDYSATDSNNDSLVYNLITPFNGGSISDAAPQPESAPPYSQIPWQAGFSFTNPFGNGVATQINNSTGILTVTPNNLGLYLIGVEVKEYRNGVLLNKQIKVFVFRVVNCNIKVPFTVSSTNSGKLIEDCGNLYVNFKRGDSTNAKTYSIIKQGNATDNLDYLFPDSIHFGVNQSSLSIPLISLLDNNFETDESVILKIIYFNFCNNTNDTALVEILIKNYQLMDLNHIDKMNICDKIESSVFVSCNVSDGIPPYNFTWNLSNVNNDSIYINSQQNFVPGYNMINISVSDFCNKIVNGKIDILNECQISIPNVITINDDGINEFFIINNLEYYKNSELVILNRWGNSVFENTKYNNDWKGVDQKGDKLIEGVYFYKISLTSFSNDINEYTGFMHIIK